MKDSKRAMSFAQPYIFAFEDNGCDGAATGNEGGEGKAVPTGKTARGVVFAVNDDTVLAAMLEMNVGGDPAITWSVCLDRSKLSAGIVRRALRDGKERTAGRGSCYEGLSPSQKEAKSESTMLPKRR